MRVAMSIAEWLDSRTGYRAGLRHLLDERLPSGTGWWFTLGSILLFLLGIQIVTGVVLTMYYAPTPDHAYDSVRFLVTQVTFGRVVRALHFFGASFVIVASVLHLLRVFSLGAYKAPREMTWISGVLLLLIMLAFGLTGYLLPWDQRAYWATVVTINIARTVPVVGDQIATLIRGGPVLGALTLSRWYAMHVILLPSVLIALVVSHLYLMRRHGIAGPARPRPGPSKPFYPFHAFKDTVAVSLVFALILSLAVFGRAPLDNPADPTDASYIPRPEWYFLGLFQLLKFFPGKLETIGAHVLPGLLVLLLLLLPFLDRGDDRGWTTRRPFMAAAGIVLAAVMGLTMLGLRDAPANTSVETWGPRALAGYALATDQRCVRCHAAGGIGPDFASSLPSRDDQWVLGHVSDPEMIAPGLRPRPAGVFAQVEGEAVISYLRKVRAGAVPPTISPDAQHLSNILGLRCVTCHVIDGEGGTDGPDLSRIGTKYDKEYLLRWIGDPTTIKPDTTMPSFKRRLSAEDLGAVAAYLAGRK